MSQGSLAEPGLRRWSVWLEAAFLGVLVALVMGWGGAVVQTSYHGFLHATIGSAVGHEGLLPENPYHAGAPLRYYTLYPWLGHALGAGLGIGAVAAFALLNIIGASLFVLALDSLGCALGLNHRERRVAFWLTFLGFNALGWVGWLTGAPERELITVPVFAFEALTFADQAWGWDARLQAFLPKFLNASSFALALPACLWAWAAGIRAQQGASPWGVALPAGIALAINPLAGGFAGLCLAIWVLPRFRNMKREQWLAWIGAGGLACALAIPFLLPAFHAAGTAESLTGTVRFQHSGWANVLGPSLLLLIPFFIGWTSMNAEVRMGWMLALALAIALAVFARLPWGNEYKLARMAGILVAIPAAIAVTRWTYRIPLAWAVLLAGVGTTGLVLREYLIWGAQGATPPLEWSDRDWQPQSEAAQRGLPPSVLTALREQPREEVLWTNLVHPGLQTPGGVVQGHAFAPLAGRALFVDRPQIHNEGLKDLADRMIACVGEQNLARLFGPQRAQAILDQASGDVRHGLWEAAGVETAQLALQWAREQLPDRAFLVLCQARIPFATEALQAAGASALADENGISLWRLAPLEAAP